MSAPLWKSRKVPRTTCDQCGRDYAETPESCRTVMLKSSPLYGETLCLRCVPKLGITGCSLGPSPDGPLQPHERIFGIDPPPRGWKGRRPSNEEILRALASCGFALPKPETKLERLDFESLIPEILGWRDRLAS